LDLSGNVYVTGNTSSNSGIATSGAQQTTFGGGTYDAFLVQFNSLGAEQWATYFGASGYDFPYSVVFDSSSGLVYIGGTTNSAGLATAGSIQNYCWWPD